MNRLLIGATDKTDLLLHFLQRDFPDGVTVIDPTGELAKAAADQLSVDLTEQAIYFEPADMAYPLGLNVLENVLPDDRQRLTEQLCSYFEAMWPNGWGAQSNFLFANCLRLLLDNNETFLGALRLLTDPSFSKVLLPKCTDPVVAKNWAIINGWDQRQRQAAMAPLQNKIGTLLMSPMIRNIVGQRETTFQNASIVIANLDRAKLGDTTAKLLGGLLIARSTGNVAIADYGFFGAPLPLPQDRFTVTVNFLDELAPILKQAILGIDEKYVFRTNKKDAEELSFYVGVLNPRQLTELATDEARGIRGLLRPERPPALNRLRALKRRTRACHAGRRLKIERTIAEYFKST
ncbi:hypothetical protein UP10_01270 [Bradyrhizobium sp. LTSPM299]|uniref:hypothetical protein n=1 Tax=Bradyrhizobium sp. LTSPM299 TaxID=1619233 RepID=UPI0005C92A0D|nr:hypothetical protein [Bradyrhizobium sp. LTSPM299]KJC62047.1 hypothetical protein UP10_01270 [Bradyrhizobium sp. LTSPM299]